MKILSIETSCDETAIAVLECEGEVSSPEFKILGNSLYSQVELHKEYGGVYPNLARREHAKNLVPLLIRTLKEAGLYYIENKNLKELNNVKTSRLKEILEKEPELHKLFFDFLLTLEIPDIDLIAVTEGPGLAPALWVGISFAEALSIIWNKPVLPVNHMEGHIWSVLLNSKNKIDFPAIALLVSGGHTELIYIKNYKDFEVIGRTRDDAVGEAFDKVGRLLNLPYPGGPQISRLAEIYREKGSPSKITLPEPMINTPDFDFSFSGLKTAVLYKLKEFPILTPEIQEEVAYAFEEAAINVLTSKTSRALNTFSSNTLIVGGGVIANSYLRKRLSDLTNSNENLKLHIPERNLATDNAIMIAMSAYLEFLFRNERIEDLLSGELKAKSNLSF